jgi:uncharacterized protein
MYITEKEKLKIIALITAIIPGVTIILFGSQARNNATKSSDIDLALDIGRPLHAEEYTEIIGVLDGTNLVYTFDIIDLQKASKSIRETIKKEGIVWTT